MNISALDLFTIGIGPSSSHTVGPMRAAKRFIDALVTDGKSGLVNRLTCELYGSLDKVIRTMWETRLDMNHKYKETSRGGLVVNVVEC